MNEPVVMLVDNGSTRAAATLSLRSIAAALSQASGIAVHPVSLQHAGRIPSEQLDGQPANVFSGFVGDQLETGCREFIVLPLFFGRSRALTSFIPEQVERLSRAYGEFRVDIADALVPLPHGEPRIVDILVDHALHTGVSLDAGDDHVVVVDHGSPSPAVNAVRRYAVDGMRKRLPDRVKLDQAVMERREGVAYDFNGELLDDLLDRLCSVRHAVSVSIAMMFLLPGRHAGAGGDIAGICAAAMARNPGLDVAISPLIGEHPALVQILSDRLFSALNG